MVQKILEVRDVSFQQILTQVNFDLRQDEVIAIMGNNGAGKSTLARLLTGLLKPTEGSITLREEGKRISWTERLRWQEVACVGQHPQRQTIGATVAEELGFGLLNLGYSVQEVKKKVIELAEQMGLSCQLNQSPSTLSGGERQRLVLASILAIQPSFLILDESLSMLDWKTQEGLLEALRKPGIGQLWITHDPHIAARADRLLVLKDKAVLDVGHPQSVLSDLERCRDYGIQSPSVVYSLGGLKHSIDTVNALRLDAIIWENVCYSNGVTLNQTVHQGEFVAIVGPSGAGKTSIIEGVAGLRLPSQGNLVIGPPGSQQGIQLIQQEAGEYLIGRTVYDEVFYTLPKKERIKRSENHQDYIREFGIPKEKIFQSPETLSGGERQRVALATALKTAPEILLLDEPLLGLDNQGKEDFLSRLKFLKQGRTILYVTHELGEVLDLADRIWLVEEGKLTLDCPRDELDTHMEQLRAAGVIPNPVCCASSSQAQAQEIPRVAFPKGNTNDPMKSVLHRLDARLKVGALAWLTLWIGWGQWEGLLLSSLGVMGLIQLSRFSWKRFRSTLIVLGWLGIFYGLAAGWVITGGWSFWEGYWSIPGLQFAGLMIWKIGIIFLLTQLFIEVTSPVEQGLGITFIMSPFLKLTPKAADILLLITLTLRFIPLIIEEGKSIWRSRLLKGARPKTLIAKSIDLARLILPLLLLVLRRAEEVGENLLARGYTQGNYRSVSYEEWKRVDSHAMVILALWTVALILLTTIS